MGLNDSSVLQTGLLTGSLSIKIRHRSGECRQCVSDCLHSVTNGSFREAKLQWRLSGNELEKMAVVSRP